MAADHPARFLREFVDQLDLAALGFALPTAVKGRPPYHPSLLLKIWLYGYYHRIRSTRKLETACREHLTLLWRTGLIQPDHNSLWRFWRDNKKALRQIFKQTVQVALHTGAAGLAERQALREQIKTGLAQLAADGRKSYHPVEPEARRMKIGDTNRYAYNAQAVADQQAGIMVAGEVTRQENDNGQLVPMIQQAHDNLGPAAQNTLTLADTGYGAGADLQAAAQHGMEVLVPPARRHARQRQPLRHPTLCLRPPTPERHLSPRPDTRS